MFIQEYSHPNVYWDLVVDAELPEKGDLHGKEGTLSFRRIYDGIAVYNSTLLTSGFVCPGSPQDVFVPGTINGIPVTELHQCIDFKCSMPMEASVAIESRNLRRVYLQDGKREKDVDTTEKWASALLEIIENKERENRVATAAFNFYGNADHIADLCHISCESKIRLHIPEAKVVEVNAPETEIVDEIPPCVERIAFRGKVYPSCWSYWDGDIWNNRCFAGNSNLKTIEGSLSGEVGWILSECTALESIHLSNGVKVIPQGAFRNCRSLKDLYIPDTVNEIGAYAFEGCTGLASIHLPSNLTRISEGMFKDCISLKKVFLADTIEVIDKYAFAGCSSLRKPWIPANIKYMSEYAFESPDV